MLVAMMYGLPGLQWESPTDHAELFSGCMSVTIGELEVSIYTKKHYIQSVPKKNTPSHVF